MNEEEIRKALDETSGAAEKLWKDEDKTRGFLDEIEGKLGEFPKLENVIDEVKTVIALLRDVLNKKYTDIPYVTIAALLGALLYLVKRRDLIPDSVPVLGQIDDVAVMVLALKLCKGDIQKYKDWKGK